MLIRKILANNVDIIFITDLEKGLHQIRQFEISPRNPIIIIGIHYEKYAHDNRVGITILEFWRRLQELKSRMRF